MRRASIFSIFVLGFALGVFALSVSDAGLSCVIFLGLLSIALLLYHYFLSDHRSRAALALAILALGVFTGSFRMFLSENDGQTRALDVYTGAYVDIEGVIFDAPKSRETGQRVKVRVERLASGGEWAEVSTGLITSVEAYPKLEYGDRVAVSGLLRKPKKFDSGNERVFDYPSYLSKDGIYYEMSYPAVEIVSRGNGNIIRAGLFSIRSAFLASINKLLPEPHGALLGGLILGVDESLGKDLLDDFRETGVIHIVVLSGYNVTIVAEGIMRVLSFLPFVFSLSAGAIAIVLFAIMTGAGATIIRASIMALIVLLARATHRKYTINRALLIAGLIMLIHNPKILVFDPSFQLSFLATLGLIYVAPILSSKFQLVTSKFQIKEIVVATLSAQIFVLPLLLFQTGQFSTVAPLVNVLILALIPTTMLLGFIAGSIGFLSGLLAFPFALITYWLLSYELAVVHFFSSIPFRIYSVPDFSFSWVLAIYLLYLLIISRLRANKKAP